MMDRVIITDLRLRCIIGVDECERREKQDVVVNVSIGIDLRKPGATDRLADTLDYRELANRIATLVEESQFKLVEALAETIARLCLENPAAREVVVRVDKPLALRFARSAGVGITRSQPATA
jgi:D-erythro-7,8-dihydroneopterin triphosphate epimerase